MAHPFLFFVHIFLPLVQIIRVTKSAQMEDERWSNDQLLYDLSGRCVASGVSTHLRKGIYLNRNRKVAITPKRLLALPTCRDAMCRVLKGSFQ